MDKYWRLKYGVFFILCEMYLMCFKDLMWKLLVLFIECLLRNIKMLEILVVWLGGFDFNVKWFKGLFWMVLIFFDNINVFIMLKLSNC